MYILLAILGLGVLIFIHELGHYFVARWVGMRVEAFGIGFGKPILTWKWQGVDWNLCWLPFGGYVRIAGMDRTGDVDLYDVKDGFYGRGPWPRILVSLAGPAANILLALVIFTGIWLSGGREKGYSETTHVIGWIDPKSELYVHGVRPGDSISKYGDYAFHTLQDHIRLPMFAGDKLTVHGVDGDTHQPFEETVNTYFHPAMPDKGIKTAGILASASYVIYDKMPSGQENPLIDGSPMVDSGLQYGDRIYWVDGERIYSVAHLSHVLNDSRSLLTIQRNGQTLLRRVPRVEAKDLRLDLEHSEELSDWQHEAGLGNTRVQDVLYIPYNLNNDCLVEGPLPFIDADEAEALGVNHPYSELHSPLQRGDRIIAVDGVPVRRSFQLLSKLQSRRVNVIVERGVDYPAVPWGETVDPFADDDSGVDNIAATLGKETVKRSSGRFTLLNPIAPKKWLDLAPSPEKRAELTHLLMEQRQKLEHIENPDTRARALQLFDQQQERVVLGIPAVQDRTVIYNPNPIQMMTDVCVEIWRTLKALFSGALSPKFLAGPVGIVQVLQVNWMVGAVEAIYWLAAISVNLAVLNLLPIPVLDGGYIMLSFYELITRRRLNAKTVEMLVMVFAVLLICAMALFTFNDLSRIFSDLLHW